MNEQHKKTSQTPEVTADEMLKNARTTGRRKREIATISKLLCIREEFLTALEEGNYRVIPEDIYILGFARSYAVELGLDPDEVILKLKKELGLVQEPKNDEKEVAEAKAESEESKAVVVEDDKESKPFDLFVKCTKYVKEHWKWFVGGFAAFVAIIVIVLLLVGGKHDDNASDIDTENTDSVVAVVEPDFRYPVHEKFDVKNAKESRVVLQAEKESWVKIEDARGNSVFSRVLIPGDVYYLPAGDKYQATFGNVGAIDVWVDGQLVKKLGPANTKKTGILMSPDALKSVGLAE